jgi:5-methylthioadenosine/S-adenosylhomocysteine deaminase
MAEREACDLLIRNALIATFNCADSFIADGAVAIRGDRIAAVGTTGEMTARFEAHTTIDGRHFLAMPGLINTHGHTPLVVTRGLIEDLSSAPMYTRSVPQGHLLSREESLALARLGFYELLRSGCTTVVDFYRQPETLAEAAREVGLRAVITGRIHDIDLDALTDKRMVHSPAIGDQTVQENMDLIARWDGAAAGLIRCDFGVHGTDTCTPDLLRRVADLARNRRGNLHIHLAHARGEVAYVQQRDGMTPTQLLEDVGFLDNRLIAAHCVFVEEEDRKRLGQAAVTVAHAPHQNAPAGNSAPIRDLAEAGARITLCTDARSGDLFEAMRLAVASARMRHGGYEPKARTVLRWATTESAAALGWAGQLAQIEAGHKADLILLDRRQPNLVPVIDGYGILCYSAKGSNVDTVIIDGRIRLAAGRPVGFDGDAIVRDAQRVSEALWQRCANRGSVTHV